MRRALQCRAQSHTHSSRALKVQYNIDHRRRCTSAERHVKSGDPRLLGGALPSPPLASHRGGITPVLSRRVNLFVEPHFAYNIDREA
jgi:hypothetical protein